MVSRSHRLLLHGAWLAFAGCGSTIAVRSPSGHDDLRPARWVLTRPDLTGTEINIAATRDAVYVADCGEAFALSRVDPDGRVAWQRRLGNRCWAFHDAVPIAANDLGAVIAVPTYRDGAAWISIVAFDPHGSRRWERHLRASIRALSMAASPDRVALCMTPESDALEFEHTALAVPADGAVVLELDRDGARIATDVLRAGNASCAYDDAHQLWLTGSLGAEPITVRGVTRSVTAGTWAIRLGDAPRFVPLYQDASTFHTTVPTGFVVYRYEHRLDFIDHEGQTRWHFDLSPKGCWLSLNGADASPTYLLANLHVFCSRHGLGRFGDVEFEDRGEPGDWLEDRDVLVELDPRTGKSRLVIDASHLPGKLTYVGGSFGFLVSGTFRGELGLGSHIQSFPATYRCLTYGPYDTPSYSVPTPRCRSGYHLRTEYPRWVFIAAF